MPIGMPSRPGHGEAYFAVLPDREPAPAVAAALGADLDERQPAVRLLWPVPHLLQQAPRRRKATAVEPGRRLIVEADGRTARRGRWWTPYAWRTWPAPRRPGTAPGDLVFDHRLRGLAADPGAGHEGGSRMSLRFRADVATTDTEYGTVLLDERNGAYWQLNPTGALVVRRLLAGDTFEQAAAALAEEFEVSRERALADVNALVEQLRSARLVKP